MGGAVVHSLALPAPSAHSGGAGSLGSIHRFLGVSWNAQDGHGLENVGVVGTVSARTVVLHKG